MCTEKDYSGVTTSKIGKHAKANFSVSSSQSATIKSKPSNQPKNSRTDISDKDENDAKIENYKKAGQIARQVKEYAKSIIKKNEKLVDIAEKIESKILEIGGELAFPVNLSIDDVAAHYTPTLHDDKIAEGLLKVDIGIHVNGCICDIAFSVDLTPEKKHAKLIEASENALKSALEIIEKNVSKSTFNDIGGAIKEQIQKLGFSPIRNLSGHSLKEYRVHSGSIIPNYDNGNTKQIGEGAFAIEPFATSGAGIVYDGAGSNIYHIVKSGQVRDAFARQVLRYILENKKMLPFSQRELEKKFGTRVLFALKSLKTSGTIEEYPQLVERNHAPVSQAETSVVIHDNKVEILVGC